MQREADDPRRVAALARRQERELRAWLYPDVRADGASLASAIDAAAVEVEELHGVAVELVRTGDVPLDDRIEALALAAREAMANSAEHSGRMRSRSSPTSTTMRSPSTSATAAPGFDPDALPPEAHGIAESIRGRMDRAGGSAVVTSTPGEGTEVELRLRRTP